MSLQIDLHPSPAATAGAVPDSAPEGSVSRLPEILFSVIVLALVAIRTTQSYYAFLQAPGSDWGISDWMIDYAAGFVRRGLGGAVLAHILRLTGWGFFPVVTVFTTAAYLGLCAWFLRVSLRLRGPAIWRFALLLNPILIIALADYGTINRKDVLFLSATLFNVLAGQSVLRRQSAGAGSRAGRALLMLLATGLCALVLALLHEGIFLFAWLPLNLGVVACVLARLNFRRSSVALLLALAFAPALLGIAASANRHGDADTAQVICSSWHFARCVPGPDFPAAIGALSWSLSRGVSLSLAYARRLPAYLLIFAIAGAVEILSVLILIPAARLEDLLALLVLPFAASLPLYVLGVDWGRWLSLVAISSLLVMLSEPLRPALFCALPDFARTAFREAWMPRIQSALMSFRGSIERHPIFFCTALVVVPVPPIAKMAVALLEPPFIIFSFLFHLFAR